MTLKSDALPEMRIERRIPSIDEFVALRQQTSWPMPSEASVKAALSATLCEVVVLSGPPADRKPEVIGMGRVIGDGALNLYIQDVIVTTAHRRNGVGAAILKMLIEEIGARFDPEATVGLMAAKGQHGFYERIGFTARPEKNFGPGMTASVRTLSNAINSA